MGRYLSATLYESVLEQHPDVDGIAIHDDFTMVGEPSAVLDATKTIIVEAQQLSLTVQPRKTKFIYLHNDVAPLTPDHHTELTQLNIPLVTDGTILLGCPVAKLQEHKVAMARSMIDDLTKIIDDCAKDKAVPVQCAMYLLRVCFNNKLDYMMRCLGPDTMLEWGVNLDAVNPAITPSPEPDLDIVSTSPPPRNKRTNRSPPSSPQIAKRNRLTTTESPSVSTSIATALSPQDDAPINQAKRNKRDRGHEQAPTTPLSSTQQAKRTRTINSEEPANQSSEALDNPATDTDFEVMDDDTATATSSIVKFDTAILNFVLTRLQLDPDILQHKRVIAQIRLPVSKGGLGLQSAYSRVCAGHTASVMNALRTKTDLNAFNNLLDNNGNYRSFTSSILHVTRLFQTLDYRLRSNAN